MSELMSLAGTLLLLIGSLFIALGALGLVRMPDLYTRLQAGTKAVTLGSLCLLLGIGLLQPAWWSKLLLLALFIALTSPIGSSTIARAAQVTAHKPWQRSDNQREAS